VFIDYELLGERNEALKVGGISPNKQIALVFKNFGRTPAIVNGIKGKCHRWQNRYLPEIETDSIKIPSGISIGSSSPWSIPAFFEGTECDINDAMSGAGSIYLYGTLMYLDMLGEQRETRFCCEWNFAEGQFFMAPNTKLNYYRLRACRGAVVRGGQVGLSRSERGSGGQSRPVLGLLQAASPSFRETFRR
jgi:hypothetical protein